MRTIYTINALEADHLETVKAQMQEMGIPTVRAYWSGDAYYAIEGSHRIAAAHALDLPVRIIEVEEQDEITGHDVYDLDDTCTVAEILEYMNGGAAAYSVEVEEI